jgi:hypothetical protein
MNTSMNFELMSTGSEFEAAAEEFERGFPRRTGAAGQGAPQRRQPQRPRRAPPRRPGPFGYARWAPWGAVPVGWSAAPSPEYLRCMQDCMRLTSASPTAVPQSTPTPAPGSSAGDDAGLDPSGNGGASDQEMTIDRPNGYRPQGNPGTTVFEVMPFRLSAASRQNGFGGHESGSYEAESEGGSRYEGFYQGGGAFRDEYEGKADWTGQSAGPFSEADEMALAAELLSVSNEAELDQFLGKLWSGIKKVGSVVGKVAQPFAGVLKAMAKKALPFVGGALGSLIPIPGVGTALGSALGGAVSNALEMEFADMELEDREFEMARRFVRIAGTAAQQLARAAPGSRPQAAIGSTLAAAAQQHLRHFRPNTVHAASGTSDR